MRTLTFILILFLFSNCSKNKELTTDNPCHQAMKDRFDSELKCTEKDKLEVNLYSGKYEENDLYNLKRSKSFFNSSSKKSTFIWHADESLL